MLLVKGGQLLDGTVEISGSKNASLPIIAASLLVERATLRNVPRIGDVFTFLKVLESYGVKTEFAGNTLSIDSSAMRPDSTDPELIKKIRVGVFLIPILLKRFGAARLPYPGGCNIGKRPIDEHVRAFETMGYAFEQHDGLLAFSGAAVTGDLVFSAGLAVTATENILIAAAARPGRSRIELAAIEPHVMDVVGFLRSLGVEISVGYDHTIEVVGRADLRADADYSVIHDYIESGTFVVLGALAARDHIDVRHARVADLRAFLAKAREAGVRYEELPDDTLRVYNSRETLRAVKVQTNIFPGFPTDLQSPFSVMLTQAEGISRVHEVMFESRLNMLMEIENMKGHSAVLNPHEALIFGPTRLRGSTVSSWDLRAGVAMILAGLVAEGETRITNVEYIDRGYEDIIGKIAKLGAVIERVES